MFWIKMESDMYRYFFLQKNRWTRKEKYNSNNK